ncbi:MAG: glutathione binding-like protein, partial [Polaromonas sp.]|uniref:glutathione S-transferase C-terminal domain-containing protein n=1 Tax=Polaromonas sp. TaxID=1869339 RepID=UPI002734D8DE
SVLDERLRGRDFIAADQFSMADITAVVAVDFARIIKEPGRQKASKRKVAPARTVFAGFAAP